MLPKYGKQELRSPIRVPFELEKRDRHLNIYTKTTTHKGNQEKENVSKTLSEQQLYALTDARHASHQRG